MSRDIQLAYNRTQPTTQIEPWAVGGSSTALGSPMAAPANPLNRIHRSMRGRYVLATILALLGAAAGGVAGYMAAKPGYVSKGAIQIRPVITQLDRADTVMQMYAPYMRSQAAILMSDERLIRMALDHPEWKANSPPAVGDPVAAFAAGLEAEFVKDTEMIGITYTHPNPDAARAGVKAVVETYKQHFAGPQSEAIQTKLLRWDKTRRDAAARIVEADRQIVELGKKYGTQDVEILHEGKWQDVTAIERAVREAELALKKFEAPASGPASEDMTVEDIAQVDRQMESFLETRRMIELEIERNTIRGAGANHANIKLLKEQLKARDAIIAERAEWFRAKYKGFRFNGDGSMDRAPVPQSLDQLQANLDQLRESLDKQRAEATGISDVRNQIRKARETIVTEREREKEAAEWVDKLTFMLENLGEVKVVASGDLPATAMDNRTKLALVGVVGGGAIPLGLLLMIGLLDTRYRYSDEATATDMQGITLLGILPNLPDRLSDPEQAAIAAHCVHQIRTMLQINGGVDGGDRRVFAVTSASPGDGKTSLTLALGLSYAACGTRTLLIDCDLVGAGLSTRMNVHASEGVLEAIANRSLLEYVRTTDIADVAILPVGSAHGYHASTLSPGALRRLIDEAKKHFDTILVDTGPVLGSIEASLVCAAADGVVLAVSRGQSRPLVEKSLSHLSGIGARLAGVVFNRAQANDFERSISGMSMRSVAAANGKNGSANGRRATAAGEAVGPVARAVAPHARRMPGEDGH